MAQEKTFESVKNIEKLQKTFDQLYDEIEKVIIGQKDVIEQILVAILCDGNALLESVPGLGKTKLVKTLADILDLDFNRIQNTPDLMPSDITGTYVIQEEDGEKNFEFQKGPIFANIILADEINRATPKTQAALLEAMQEKQVSMGTDTFKLDEPFFVLATQNPIDQEGTYPLPEAQMDRFMFKIIVDYPPEEDELEIVNRFTSEEHDPNLQKVLSRNSLQMLQKLTRQMPIADDLRKRVVKLVNQTRNSSDLIEYGASPRASINLILASKARAMLHGRKYVASEDIDAMAYPVLRHRIILSFEAERQGLSEDDAIERLL